MSRKIFGKLKCSATLITIMVSFSLMIYFFGFSLTGFAIFSTGSESDFDEGTYTNTEYDGDHVGLSSGQTSGTSLFPR